MPRDTPSQLRRDIDSGRTGDKVPWPDPAAVPLGSDEEAAGTPLDAQAVQLARETAGYGPIPRSENQPAGWTWLIIVAVAAATLAAAWLAM